MKKITSFTHLITAEGSRISYTYSEIDDNGILISDANRRNFVVIDSKIEGYLSAISQYITDEKLPYLE